VEYPQVSHRHHGTTAPSSDILKQLAREVARTPQEQVMEVGDRNTISNLRYKHGRNLTYVNRDVLVVKDPATVFLPKANVSTVYIFAKSDRFFVYPNNYNHFVTYFRHTFQHGGISLEEMLVPWAVLNPR